MDNYKSYAYAILVNGEKKVGGSIHAISMEEAIEQAARRNKMTIRGSEPTRWYFRDKQASIYIFASAEQFTHLDLNEEAKSNGF